MTEFAPEINVLSIRESVYRPMFRLRPTDRWCLVQRDRKPVECATAAQAKKVAQDLVDAIVNPVRVIEEAPAPLGSTDAWKRDKHAALLADRERLFGDAPRRVYADGRERRVSTRGVTVEHRRVGR